MMGWPIKVALVAASLAGMPGIARAEDQLVRTIEICLTHRDDAHSIYADMANLGWIEVLPADLDERSANLIAAFGILIPFESGMFPDGPDIAAWRRAWGGLEQAAKGIKRLKSIRDVKYSSGLFRHSESGSTLQIAAEQRGNLRSVTCRIMATEKLMPEMSEYISQLAGGDVANLPPVRFIPERLFPHLPKPDDLNDRYIQYLALDAKEISAMVETPFDASASVETKWIVPPFRKGT